MKEKIMQIIKKIQAFIANIFNHNKVEMLEEHEETKIVEKNQNENYQKNKNEIFDIYQKIKKGEYDIKNLKEEQSEKVIALLNEELKIKKESLNNKITELNILKQENKGYEKERIFELYKQTKNKTIDLSSLSYQDLVKMKELMKEELKYHTKKAVEEEQYNQQLEKEIQCLVKNANI